MNTGYGMHFTSICLLLAFVFLGLFLVLHCIFSIAGLLLDHNANNDAYTCQFSACFKFIK